MNKRRILVLVLTVLALSVAAVFPALAAEKYPSKPIELIVPYSAGGSTDVLARAIAKVAPKYFDVPLVVVNKAGGGAIPGRDYVVQSKPDGYILLFGYGSGEDLVVPHERPLPFDTFKDLLPVCRISQHSVVLAVPADSQFKTLKDLVTWAKSRPHVTAAVSTKGAAVDIAFQLFAKEAGFKLTSIPMSGGSDAVTALTGHQVDFGGGHPSEVLPHIKADRLRPLAVALAERDPAVDVPTFKEQGYDVVTAGSVKGIAVPKGTPRAIIDYLADKFHQITRDPEFISMMKDLGQPILYMGPDEYAGFLKKGFDQYGNLLKELKIETK
ncbi:MAG: tripartite tricarboxylate transporter substrate binding protein [Firmicutes bacterium]|nr:tripartite tricarboxylate transporter substrate binding protein [Bacillota bacterium]